MTLFEYFLLRRAALISEAHMLNKAMELIALQNLPIAQDKIDAYNCIIDVINGRLPAHAFQ